MPSQFYISPSHLPASRADSLFSAGDEFPLNDTTAHHLATVLRAKRGQEITCFNGLGQKFEATITNASRRLVEVKVTCVAEPQNRAVNPVSVVLSMLKGQAMDRAIQLATELDAAQITLVNAGRSNVSISGDRGAKKQTHWERIIIKACEQCGRSFLPSIDISESWREHFDRTEQIGFIALDMDAPRLEKAGLSTQTTVLVGPEGGWDANEKDLFTQAGVPFCSIGSTTLRAETAPGIALALIEHLQA